MAWARDTDSSAPRFDARDFDIDTEKFAYFAVSLVWRRTIHEWHSAIPRWELGQIAEDMRRFLLGETQVSSNTAVLVMVCSDTMSRRIWMVPEHFDKLGCLNFSFTVRGIFFRVVIGRLPQIIRDANCLAPHRPIFLADCEKRINEGWENTKMAQKANSEKQA